MKVSCEGVLVFTLACLVGGLHNGVQGQECCNHNDTRLCFGSCEEGYYEDGEANETLTCATTTTVNPAPSAENSSTTPTTTTTTITTSSSTTAPLPAVFCSKCADGCKTCNGSSNAECRECFDNFYNSTENGTVVCRKKEGEDGYPIPLIVGVTVGGVVVVAVVVGLVVFFCRRCQRPRTFGGGDQELGRGMGINDDDSTDSDTAPEVKSTPRKEGNDENPRVNTRKVVEEPTYINVQTQSQSPTSIENSHDKVLRYTRDPTLKAGKAAYNRSQSEEEELQKLPEAPRLPGPKPKPLPPDDVYEINGDEPTDVKKLTAAAPPRHAPIEYEDVDSPTKVAPSTKPKPKPKPTQKPALKPQTRPKKPIPASEKPDDPPQSSYEPLELPVSGGGKQPKTGGKKSSKAIIGGATSKGRADGGRRKTEGSLPHPSSPVSCPANLPQFPVEEAEEEERKKKEKQAEEERKKKKQQAARKKEQEQKTKSLPSGRRPNDDDVSDPEDGYENAPDKKSATKKLPRFASSPARPKPLSLSPAAGTDSEPEGDYENEKSLLALKSVKSKAAHGTQNPAAEIGDAEDSDPQEVYGNQDVIDEEQGRLSGKGYYNTTHARGSVGATGDASGPEDEYEEMSGNKTDDDVQPVYGNEGSDEDEPAYQNIAEISPRRKT